MGRKAEEQTSRILTSQRESIKCSSFDAARRGPQCWDTDLLRPFPISGIPLKSSEHDNLGIIDATFNDPRNLLKRASKSWNTVKNGIPKSSPSFFRSF